MALADGLLPAEKTDAFLVVVCFLYSKPVGPHSSLVQSDKNRLVVSSFPFEILGR